MSLEIGGRADKYGNEYENQYLARLLLRVVGGEYKSIVVEPLGNNKDAVEYIATDKNDNKWYFQCKASNTTNTHWTMYDLSKYDVFKRARSIINESANNHYVFISPLTYGELPELCRRARTNASVEEFKNHQLTNTEIKSTFNGFAKYGDFILSDDVQYSELVNVLSKCDFNTVPSGHENIMDLNEHVGFFFTGDTNAARCLLQNYVNSNEKLGVVLTACDIISFMEKSGFPTRNNIHSDNLSIKINELNDSFSRVFQPINQTIIHRTETDRVINDIMSGKSVVLHGKAGTGKSGCVQEVIQELKNKGVLFLALKLDKFVPQNTADHYGRELGLQQSPVYCLHNLSAGTPCILLLDQLDSLRWTSHHSANALDICKEFISQVRLLNKHHNGHVSILFVSRTFDLENDAGLRSLLTPKDNDPISWAKIQVNTFTHEEVRSLIGSEYNGLSAKLKNLLQTPSSLYIWTLLNDHARVQSISTPFQLIEHWWKQINDKCISSGLDVRRVTEVKDNIVRKMETTSLFSLPGVMFTDYNNEIEYLTSNGLLAKGDNSISFAHQSFLDFFAVAEKINEIFEGKNITEIIGGKQNQTPHLRYRLLRILQNILETTEDLFVKMCEDILSSDDIRHYFKCTVFEVAGQLECPSNTLLKYVHQYYVNPEWHEYVHNTVYLGHPQYIEDLDNYGPYDWLSDEGLTLLRSINTKSQDFVLEKIKPICFKDKENDIIAYRTLCHDCTEDSAEMFEIRLKLFESNLDFLRNFWGSSNLVKNNSEKLIPILKLIVEHSDELTQHIYMGEPKELTTYAQNNYHKIILELLPAVCTKTKNFKPQWPNYELSSQYRDWTRDSYNEHPARDVVRILKSAMCEFSIKEPEEFISFVTNYNDEKSVVYYEIISSAINNLNTSYSDFAISWLCSDIHNHLFIYTANQEDYLSTSKKIIEKFTSYCSNAILLELETIIHNWKEPTERMVNTYKHRLEVNRSKEWRPVYYSFWGHLQKELLPFIDINRLSTNSRALLQVLNRNEWIRAPFYNCGFHGGSAKSVVSPIHGKTEKLSDKKWLEIISTDNEKMSNHFNGSETSEYYIEANHVMFSSSLSTQAKREPTRFARLSFNFPSNCFPSYISSVISALYSHENDVENIDFTLICDVIKHFKNHSDPNVIKEILRLVAKYSKENWPQEIIDFICVAAIQSPDPAPEEYSFRRDEASKALTPHGLLNNAVNCVRGTAFETISKLLWEHPEYGDIFKTIIESACEDKNDAVVFSIMFCVLPYFQIDNDFCIRVFKKLVSKDIRILGYPNAWEIISRDYSANGAFYAQKLFEACFSDIEELEETSAGLICAAGIFYDNNLIDKLFHTELNDKQIDSVCNQAISSFNDVEFHDRSKEVLLNYINIENYEVHSFGRLFFDNGIDIDRDKDFLIHLMSSKQKPYQLQSFLEFILQQDKDITNYANVMKSICENIVLRGDDLDREWIIEKLIKCIIKLFDNNRSDKEVQSLCLDMWDNLYQHCLKSIKPFAEIFDNMN